MLPSRKITADDVLRLLDRAAEFKGIRTENGSHKVANRRDATLPFSIMGTDRIQSFLMGAWHDGAGDGHPLFNPATEEVIAAASTEGLNLGAALEFARKTGGPPLRAMTFVQRAGVLERIGALMVESREPLIESAMVNGGCTRGDAKMDVDGAALVFNHYAELGKSLGDRTTLIDGDGIQLGRTPRFWGQHVLVPRHGVAVLVNAFNFPAWGFAEKAACALLAGMPVLNKPALPTAHTAWLLSTLIVEKADLPTGAYSFLAGEPADLVEHLTEQDVLAFTGSAATGKRLRAHPRIVDRSVKINVEADSLNAAVLGPDVDDDGETFDLFIREVAREMTQKTGQKCTASRRILVPASAVDRVVAQLGDALGEVVIGNPSDKTVRMGPVASAKQHASVREGLAALRTEADVVWGDPDEIVDAVGAPAGKGYFVGPVLLRARDPETARLVHEREVFGPVSTILVYDGSPAQAIDWVCRGQGGLVTSVYSDDRVFCEKMVAELGAFHGRVYLGSEKMASVALGPGLVLPQCVHGGPGRAGGGEELGGLRGVHHYMHRVAIQGARAMVERVAGTQA